MSRKPITVDDVEPVLKAIASADPDHVDRRAGEDLPARYVEHGKPSCLVARVLVKLGFSLGVLRQLDTEHPIGWLFDVGVPIAESRHPALKRIDPLAMQLLKHVQDQQDKGLRWGVIVVDALHVRKDWFFGDRRERERKPWLFRDADRSAA